MPTRPISQRPAAPVRVILAAPVHLPFLVALQKRHGDALGFIPRMALAEKIGHGQILISIDDASGVPAGFLHHGSLAGPEVRIFQAAVVAEARRRRHGIALVREFVARATAAGAFGVSLRCLDALAGASAFWRAAGFELIGTEPGGRGALNVWGMRLANAAGTDFAFHSRVHPCPRCGQPTTGAWTRGAVRHRVCPRCVNQAEGVARRAIQESTS